MKVYGFSFVFVLTAMALGGCAKDNLDSLHLVSREEISVQKRQSAGTAESTSVDLAAVTAETAAPAETVEAKKPAAQ